MLRNPSSKREAWLGIALLGGVGALAAWLVAAGNPGNMGVCGACFLRDVGGSLGLFASGSRYFRPEVAGLALGAFLAALLVRRRFTARSGSHAVVRFFFGAWMAIGALVFLGCPFRLFQRLGGGDVNALVGAAGLALGVGVGLVLERRGYSVGKTQEAPLAVGLLGLATLLTLLVLFVLGVLLGPGAADRTGAPAHAPWALALGLGALAGGVLSLTGFCGVNAMRQAFRGPRWMLFGALALVGVYALVSLASGRFHVGLAGQPVAHSDHPWNVLGMTLVGLTGVLAGGCPVRQVVMAGEGNGDAFVTCMGLVVGGAVAHNLGLVSSAEGATGPGRIAVGIGLAFALVYGFSSLARPRPSDGARA